MFKSNTMPKVNMEKIWATFMTEEERNILSIVIKKDNTIRATKPKVKKENPLTGKAAYVWRMVCFYVSPKGPHQCMPVTANFDLPAYNEDGQWKCAISRPMEKELDKLVNTVVDCVDKSDWHGVHRWSRAFGSF